MSRSNVVRLAKNIPESLSGALTGGFGVSFPPLVVRVGKRTK